MTGDNQSDRSFTLEMQIGANLAARLPGAEPALQPSSRARFDVAGHLRLDK